PLHPHGHRGLTVAAVAAIVHRRPLPSSDGAAR
ncbi:uncharacterized protein METZ01_LOCUS327747, partial [marine metagenome]